jgi:hypothetical protein
MTAYVELDYTILGHSISKADFSPQESREWITIPAVMIILAVATLRAAHWLSGSLPGISAGAPLTQWILHAERLLADVPASRWMDGQV